MKTYRQNIGAWGEAVAAGYLEKKGYAVLDRNAHTRYGELDLVARAADGLVVFVEVKTRTGGSMGDPEEAVDPRKLAHLCAAAEAYLLAKPEWGAETWRIDAVAVQGKPGDRVADVIIEHFENIA